MGSKIFTEQEKQSLFQNAIDMVDEAGKITIGYFKQNLIIENKDENFFNPVTIADKSAEKKIREMIEKLYPNDSIIGEEYGFIGYLIFIFILSTCIISFFLIAVREKNEFKKIFISGLGAWILFQSLLNLGASVYLLPITGIVLPFVSYGGTAMVSIFVALGIMHCRVDE